MDEFCHVSPILIHDSRGRTTNAKFTNYINVHERINENTHSNYHQQTQHNQPRPFAFDVLPVDRRCQSSSSSVVPSTFHSASNSSVSAIINHYRIITMKSYLTLRYKPTILSICLSSPFPFAFLIILFIFYSDVCSVLYIERRSIMILTHLAPHQIMMDRWHGIMT